MVLADVRCRVVYPIPVIITDQRASMKEAAVCDRPLSYTTLDHVASLTIFVFYLTVIHKARFLNSTQNQNQRCIFEAKS